MLPVIKCKSAEFAKIFVLESAFYIILGFRFFLVFFGIHDVPSVN